MPPFDSCRSQLSVSHQASLDQLLSEWEGSSGTVASFAAANLRGEFGFEDSILVQYLTMVADGASQLSLTPPGPLLAFENIGRPFRLGGHQATPYGAAVLGRAILVEKYARYLAIELSKLGCYDDPNRVRKTLGLLSGDPAPASKWKYQAYVDGIKQTALGVGAVFATFAKPFEPDKSPWQAPIPNATAIRNRVALGEDEVGKDYILFAYRLPSGTSAFVPTSASPGWWYQRWFRPSPSARTDLHGFTSPLDPTLPPLPEIVHPQLSGATVVFPYYVATA